MRGLVFSAIAVAALSGCYTFGQAPRMGQVQVTPGVLSPGSTGLITVAISDSYDIVDRVKGMVQVEPPIPIPLYDDGTHGDVEAGDGLWSFSVPVPIDAPVGEYEIVFTAYTDDGLPVEVRTKEREVVALQAGLPFVIAYPKE